MKNLYETRCRNISCLSVGFIIAYIRIKLNAIGSQQEKNPNPDFFHNWNVQNLVMVKVGGRGRRIRVEEKGKKNKERRIREEEKGRRIKEEE